MYQVWIWKVMTGRFVLFATYDSEDAAIVASIVADSNNGRSYIEKV